MLKDQALLGWHHGTLTSGVGMIAIGCLLTDLEQQVEHVLRRRLGMSSTSSGRWLITRIGWTPTAGDEHRNPWEIADELEEACRRTLTTHETIS